MKASRLVTAGAVLITAVLLAPDSKGKIRQLTGFLETPQPGSGPAPDMDQQFSGELVAAARKRLSHKVRYISAYVKIAYPGGDVPEGTGVCSDEIVRIYRAVGIDLQKLVHTDMLADFKSYPRQWALSAPDPNIDHRRVLNLLQFFKRKGALLKVSDNASNYLPGDVVAWDLGRGVTHIGIVVDTRVAETDRRYILHNIGRGPKLEDFLFRAKIIGHARYHPDPSGFARRTNGH